MPKTIVEIEPFAVRPKDAARLDGCGLTQLYERLNAGEYESYLDGCNRMITVRSIRARQERKLAAAINQSFAKSKRAGGPGRPKKITSS
jgi:hypothetical protein